MNVTKKDVAILLSDEGRQVVQQMAAIRLPDVGPVASFVQDTDDLGLWVVVEREDGDHLLLVRWAYMLSVDIPAGGEKAVGIRP